MSHRLMLCLLAALLGMFQVPVPAQDSSVRSDRFGIDLLWYGVSKFNQPSDVPEFVRLSDGLGVGWIRVDVHWDKVEPTKGKYDWSLTDRIVTAAGSKYRLLFTLYANSRWGTKEGPTKKWAMPSSPPVRDEDYKAFVEAIVRRYQGRVDHWQIENEVYGAEQFWKGTAQEYVQLLTVAARAVRKVDPKAKVLPAGIALGELDVQNPEAFQSKQVQAATSFLDLVFQEGRQSFDVVDLHLYWKHEAIRARVQFLKARMKKFGVNTPIWNTEMGGPDIRAYFSEPENRRLSSEYLPRTKTGDAQKLSYIRAREPARIVFFDEFEDQRYQLQAQEVVKRSVVTLASGVEKVFWLKLRYETEEDLQGMVVGKMSLTDQKRKPRAGYDAYRLLIEKIGDFTQVKPLDWSGSGSAYTFNTPRGSVIIAWDDAGKGATGIPVSWTVGQVTQLDGTNMSVDAKDGQVALPLTADPVFLEKSSR